MTRSADVEGGYTRFRCADQPGTPGTLREHREFFDISIGKEVPALPSS